MATLYRFSYEQVFDANGDPLSGAKLYFYVSGTSTPKNTYSDQGLTVANGNPVIADAAGRFGPIFLDIGAYKVVLHTADGALVWTSDPEDGASASPISGGGGYKNLLVNSAFQFNRTGAASVADNAYGFDRWRQLNQSGNVAISAQTNQEDGTPTNIQITQPDVSPKRFGISQVVESDNCRHLRGANVALSFRLRASVGQAIRYAVLEWTGTKDAVTADVVNDWTSTSYTPGGFFIAGSLSVVSVGQVTPAGGVWTAAPAITGLVSSSMNNLIVFIWTEGTFAQNATLDISLVQLEAGASATAYEYQDRASVALNLGYSTSVRITAPTNAIDFVLPAGFTAFRLRLSGLVMQSNDTGFSLLVSIDGGATFVSSGYFHEQWVSPSAGSGDVARVRTTGASSIALISGLANSGLVSATIDFDRQGVDLAQLELRGQISGMQYNSGSPFWQARAVFGLTTYQASQIDVIRIASAGGFQSIGRVFLEAVA